jgi:hypothetical protein
MSNASDLSGFPGTTRKVVLFVLFVPSADRRGKALGERIQNGWRDDALALLADLFGGATAMPRCHGVWCDRENGGNLIADESIMVQSYATESDISDSKRLGRINEFCVRMLKELRQGEVVAVVNNVLVSWA